MGENSLACLHSDTVQCCEGDDTWGVTPYRVVPVVGGVRETARQREVGDEVAPVVEIYQSGLGIVNDCFRDGDQRAIEDDNGDYQDSVVPDRLREHRQRGMHVLDR